MVQLECLEREGEKREEKDCGRVRRNWIEYERGRDREIERMRKSQT